MRTLARAAAVAALAVGACAWTPSAAAEPVELGGEPIARSTDSADPAALTAGLWSTELEPSQPQYFTYERQIEDSTVHVGVVGTPQTADYNGFTVAASVTSPEDESAVDCGTADASSDTTYPQAVIGDELVVGSEESADDPCRSVGTIAIMVERYADSGPGSLPVAIKIVEEAPVTDGGQSVADDGELAYDVPDRVDAADGPQGARSFDDAPAVDAQDGAVTVATRVAEGDSRLWRVSLEWGDQLVVRADLPGVEEALHGASVQLRIVQPSRDVFALTASDDYYYGQYGADPVRLVAAAHPLRYANRSFDIEPTLPGDYWVAVDVAPAPTDRAASELGLELTFATTGGDGTPPTYQDAVLGEGGGAGPDGYAADTPYLVGDGRFSAVASGSPVASETDAEGWWGPRRGVGLGLGVLSLTCCAAGAVWLTRRRAARLTANRQL